MSWNVDAAPSRVHTTGKIVGVVVHGRGAVVTRKITVETPLPHDAFDLVIGGITPLADAGSIRVQLPAASRELIGVNARIELPEEDTGPGQTTARVEELNREIDRLHRRESQLAARLNRLQSTLVLPRGRQSLRKDGPAARVEHAMSLNHMIHERIAAADDELAALRLQIQDVVRERDAAQLEDRQTSGADRMGEGHPMRAFDLRIAAGEASLEEFEISYAVPYAAKWWPQYTLRLTDGGTKATLSIEALVAQRTGEDWTNVPLGLSTASIIHDATLPKLPSLRLGKAQPPEHRGFREPPAGGELLFESYDAFNGRKQKPRRAPAPTPVVTMAEAAVELDEETFAMNAPTGASFAQASFSQPPPAPAAPMKRKREKAMAAAPSPSRGDYPTAMRMSSFGAAPGGGIGGGGAPPPEAPAHASHDPGADWLEFDSLVLGGRDDRRRGQLKKRPAATGMPESELFDAQESARRLNLTDPAVSRGMFDYRYDSDGSARVPADGRLHRVAVRELPATSRLEWKTVPLVDPAVYREAKLSNPFPSPLLSGPVDVFSEGQLVTTTQISRVDAGGSMRVGLGVDERIRVARNVRMAEESAGLLGGKRELIHDVEIELRSGLSVPISVEVVDRVPVTTDDHVDIELERESLSGSAYDQSELDHPIQGGRRWNVGVDAGGRATLEMRYQITLRSKDELVGGNRRD